MLLTNETIGKQIAHHRKKRKLTQKELAANIGLPYRYVSDLETGRRVPRIHTLARLATGLGISIDELVGIR
ncbi:helix-turn-helix domain-containing protein [Desulfosporosinus metallidurans]|uniref:helix-turn-helix domain-containing protein n=1 Tax=Desulfosporosinus metallidurans TaxID=1888891 RepID=UPI00094DE936|nr:helix-turn-helix transcriptional regulator [Desulfosporosinus metallidurans]